MPLIESRAVKLEVKAWVMIYRITPKPVQIYDDTHTSVDETCVQSRQAYIWQRPNS